MVVAGGFAYGLILSFCCFIVYLLMGIIFSLFGTVNSKKSACGPGFGVLFSAFIFMFVCIALGSGYKTELYTDYKRYSMAYILPLSVLMLVVYCIIYSVFDRHRMEPSFVKNSAFARIIVYLLLALDLYGLSFGNSYVLIGTINYAFDESKPVTIFVELKEVNVSKVNEGKRRIKTYYNAIFKNKLFDIDHIRIDEEVYKKYKEGGWLKLEVYRGRCDIPYVFAEKSDIVDKSQVPEELKYDDLIKENYKPKSEESPKKLLPVNGY